MNITNTITSSFNINYINPTHITQDNPIAGTLKVTLTEAQPPQIIVINGSAYQALGQWNDTTLSDYLASLYSVPVSGSSN